jgi:hypothetical protein
VVHEDEEPGQKLLADDKTVEEVARHRETTASTWHRWMNPSMML